MKPVVLTRIAVIAVQSRARIPRAADCRLFRCRDVVSSENRQLRND
jgi:hypothetical protein